KKRDAHFSVGSVRGSPWAVRRLCAEGARRKRKAADTRPCGSRTSWICGLSFPPSWPLRGQQSRRAALVFSALKGTRQSNSSNYRWASADFQNEIIRHVSPTVGRLERSTWVRKPLSSRC